MPLDLDTLTDLYPDPEGRRQFLQRALDILREDRQALQDALGRHAYGQAAELAHRLQGSVAFLTGEPEHCARILLPLQHASRRGQSAECQQARTAAMELLVALESAMEQSLSPDPTRLG
ncbi:hypothetical protein [Bordetella bronchialis]|nr:hypothetical protein [Bordetella bronchialis]